MEFGFNNEYIAADCPERCLFNRRNLAGDAHPSFSHRLLFARHREPGQRNVAISRNSHMSIDRSRNSRPSRLRWFATVLNVLALPLYALLFSMLAEQLHVPSKQFLIGFVGGALSTAVAVFAWQRSERAGAITQLLLVAPIVASCFIPRNWKSWTAFEFGMFLDWRALAVLGLTVVIPSAVVATALIGLRRSRRENTGP